MTVLAGPLVYLTDGAHRSLSAFPQVERFAAAIGSRVLLAQVQRSSEAEPKPDPRFAAALASVTSGQELPTVLPVSRRKLGAGLLARTELRGATLALLPQRHGGLARLVFGTSYERLLRETNMPLLALPDDGQIGTVRRMLFPADLSPRSVPAFDQTLALCQQLGATLDILHVYGDDKLLSSEVDWERRKAAKSPRELFNIHREGITALVDRARAAGVAVEQKSAEGRAHTQILTYTASNPIDLVVMPTHGPRSVEDVFRGSTTTRVIQKSPVPVLVFCA